MGWTVCAVSIHRQCENESFYERRVVVMLDSVRTEASMKEARRDVRLTRNPDAECVLGNLSIQTRPKSHSSVFQSSRVAHNLLGE